MFLLVSPSLKGIGTPADSLDDITVTDLDDSRIARRVSLLGAAVGGPIILTYGSSSLSSPQKILNWQSLTLHIRAKPLDALAKKNKNNYKHLQTKRLPRKGSLRLTRSWKGSGFGLPMRSMASLYHWIWGIPLMRSVFGASLRSRVAQ